MIDVKKIAILFSIPFLFIGCKNNIEPVIPKVDRDEMIIDNIRVENYFYIGVNRQAFTKVPERVLVIGANESETFMDLGIADTILVAANHQDNPVYGIKKSNLPQWNKIPKIDHREINKERVLSLRPDMIVAQEEYYSHQRLGSTDYWNSKGIYTMVPLNTTAPGKNSKQETIEEEMRFIKDLGKIFQCEEQADKIAAKTYDRINYINKRTENIPKPKVMILDLISVTASYGKNKIAGNIATAIGGIVPDTTAAVNDEIIMNENPDVVFLVTYGDADSRLKRLWNKKAFQNLNFIKNRRLYAIPLKYVYGPETRTIDAIGYIADKMYPGLFDFPKEYNFHSK